MTVVMINEVKDILVKDQMLKDAGAYCLDGYQDTTNMTVFAEFADVGNRLTRQIFREGIQCLAAYHPFLRSSFLIVESNVFQILLRYPKVPITYYHYNEDSEQWRNILKNDLSKRFTAIDEPAWRVSFILGDKKGQIFLTFHHALVDGLGAAARMNQLFGILAKLMKGKSTPIIEMDFKLPHFEKLFPNKSHSNDSESKKAIFPKPKNYEPCYTDFARLVLDKELTARIQQFSKNFPKVNVHSLLYAAFLKATVKVKKPAFDCFSALNIVSFRKELNAENVMRPLFTWLMFDIDANLPFMELAEKIKSNLHGMLEKGVHKQNLLLTRERLLENPTPAQLIAESKMPPNVINLSNIGEIKFDGDYEVLKMTTLDAAGGCTPYFDYAYQTNGVNMSLAARTFNGQLRLVLNFPRLRITQHYLDDENVIMHKEILNEIAETLHANLSHEKFPKL